MKHEAKDEQPPISIYQRVLHKVLIFALLCMQLLLLAAINNLSVALFNFFSQFV
jgi:uncharacterized integral membrane protein